MVSGPITSWQIDGETVETVADFILGAPLSLQKVTAAMNLKDACSLEDKLPTKVSLVKAMVFPVSSGPLRNEWKNHSITKEIRTLAESF